MTVALHSHYASFSAHCTAHLHVSLVTTGKYCMYCGMPKGTTQAEVTSSIEKIKPVVVSIVE